MAMRVKRSLPRLAALTAPLLLAACASTQVNTQWADPQFTGRSLHGVRVLVACDAYDLALKQQCEQQLASELSARGAGPVIGALVPSAGPADVRQQAEAANAQAALAARVTYSESYAAPGYVSIGIGGWGIGGGSTRTGAGVGVSVPMGGGGAAPYGHTTRGNIIDTASGRAMWSFSVTTAPSNDYGSQMGEMAKKVGSAAAEAGLLPK
jgi:hypothetical protein